MDKEELRRPWKAHRHKQETHKSRPQSLCVCIWTSTPSTHIHPADISDIHFFNLGVPPLLFNPIQQSPSSGPKTSLVILWKP